MKAVLFTFLFIQLNTAEVQWLLEFEPALEIAQKENKNILLYFSGSDWCKPCIQLKTYVLDTDEFEKFASERYILLQADFTRLKKNRLSEEQVLHNEMLAGKYNPKGIFPLIVVLDNQGNVKYKVEYRKENCEAFIEQLKRLEEK